MNPTPADILERTRAFTDADLYLSSDDAIALTGHSHRTLVRLSEEGKLVARRDGNSLMYQAEYLLAYLRRQTSPATLFDALSHAPGVPVTDSELDAELAKVRSGTWWTVARRDNAPPDWPSWCAWYAGDIDQASTLLPEEGERWAQEHAHLRARGLTHRTLWIHPQPLGRYGAYSRARYEHLVEAGANVKVSLAWKFALLETRRMLPDLEVTPGAVYVRRFTMVGSREGALRIDDPDLLTATTAYLEWVDSEHAHPLPTFSSSPQPVRW